jgi:GNAT superfamily N-acetyltransferase
VLLRPIRSEDAGALTRLYDRLSPQGAYQRFFTPMRRLPPDGARILADVDHERRAAVVAAKAEIAVVAEEAWQHRGLGTILLSAFIALAESRGISRFPAYVLADNRRMLGLIGRLGRVTERSLDQGVVTLRFTPRPDVEDSRPPLAPGIRR